MTAGDRYATPAAFRRALTDRLKRAAKDGRWSLQQLQRQVAYDRLIERLYFVDDGWIVKGATALLARDIGVREVSTFTSIALSRGRWRRTNCDERQPLTLAIGSVSKSAVGRRSPVMPSGFRSIP